MSEEKHTPLPWSIRPKQFDDWGYIRGANGDLACCARSADNKGFEAHRVGGTDPYQANADLIVRSVNAVPALVRALKKSRDAIHAVYLEIDNPSMPACLAAAWEIADTALADYRKDS